jgi:MFS family permease
MFVEATLFGCLAPLLPEYTREFGLSKAEAGLLSAMFPIGIVVGCLPAGGLAARYGARPTVFWGLVLMALPGPVFGLAHSTLLLEAARFVQGLGSSAVWGGGIAWLVYETPAAERGAVVGRALGIGIAGSVCGPAIGGLASVTSPAFVFGLLVPGVLAGLAVWALVVPAHARPEPGPGPLALLASPARPTVTLALWLVAWPGAGTALLSVLGPLRLSHYGAGGLLISLTFVVAAVGEALMSAAAGRASDRHGRRLPVAVALAVSAVALVAIPASGALVLIAAGIVVAMTMAGAAYSPSMALLTDASAAARLPHGPDVSLFLLIWSIGWVVGSAAIAGLAQVGGDELPFLIVAVALVVTLVGSWVAGPRWTPVAAAAKP